MNFTKPGPLPESDSSEEEKRFGYGQKKSA